MVLRHVLLIPVGILSGVTAIAAVGAPDCSRVARRVTALQAGPAGAGHDVRGPDTTRSGPPRPPRV